MGRWRVGRRRWRWRRPRRSGRSRTLIRGNDSLCGLDVNLAQDDHFALTVGRHTAQTDVVAEYRACVDKNIFSNNRSRERNPIENLYIGVGTREQEKSAARTSGGPVGRLHLEKVAVFPRLIDLEHDGLFQAAAVVAIDLGVDHEDVSVDVNFDRVVCIAGNRQNAVLHHQVTCDVVSLLLRSRA